MKLNFLKENIGKILLDIGLANSFLDTRPKPQAKKAKINKWYYIKLKFLHCQKKKERENENTIHRMEENTYKSYI